MQLLNSLYKDERLYADSGFRPFVIPLLRRPTLELLPPRCGRQSLRHHYHRRPVASLTPPDTRAQGIFVHRKLSWIR